LFVSPIRARIFVHEHAGVSPSVNAILEALTGTAVINRKQLFEKLIGDVTAEDAEPRKLAFASDLRWLINEGYVIEFNDGSLDLPRAKPKKESSDAAKPSEVAAGESKSKDVVPEMPAAEKEERVEAGAPATPEESGRATNDVVAAAVSTDKPNKQAVGISASTTDEPAEIGGS
jgi:hypothetical protein